MPGQKLSKEDLQRIDPKFLCPACEILLKEPCQTICGHLLCLTCISYILSSTNPVCPVDGTILKQEEVFPDQFTKRELQCIALHCSNNNCSWSGMYKDLQGHLNCCEHTLVKCVHDKCEKEIERCLLGQHLESECEYRLVPCTYCKEDITITLLKDHVDVQCLAVPLTCKHCGNQLQRNEMEQHEKFLCENRQVKCDFIAVGCTYDEEVKREKLHKHQSSGLLAHVQLLLAFILEISGELRKMVPKEEILRMIEMSFNELKEITQYLRREVTSLINNVPTLIEKITGLEKRVEKCENQKGGNNSQVTVKVEHLERKLENVEERNKTLENQLRETTFINQRLKTKLDQMDESMTLITVKLSDMESSNQTGSPTNYNGTLIWKIDDFKRKRENAINGSQKAIYSPYFYSSQFGYKMCVRIYLNGDGFGKDTHISLFFVVMNGEYDALLPWAFQKKITMMLLDQVNGDHMIDAFRTDPESTSFQRPKTNMNVASGSPLFMALNELGDRGYVKDDTIFIKVIVD